jgi:plasmid stabilization system protein ParE
MRLEFHPEAQHELNEAAERYEGEVTGLGERLGAEVERATTLLLRHPEIGAPLDEDLRSWVLYRFPFTLIYSVSTEAVRVVAVAHQSRRPEYWRSRVGDETTS